MFVGGTELARSETANSANIATHPATTLFLILLASIEMSSFAFKEAGEDRRPSEAEPPLRISA